MLTEILCDKFLENPLKFHSGLNVILGDDKATNSIGKSSILMVIDFVFGGDSFCEHHKDAVDELGDHAYHFSFKFNNKHYKFKRETYDPKVVYICNEKYEVIGETDIESFRDTLRAHYDLASLGMTFRSIVSLYSRIWGKDNVDDVKRPLNNAKKQSDADAIDILLKLFDKYKEIAELSKKLKEKTETKKALSKAIKYKHIPRINKTEYNKNENAIEEIKNEIEEIKQNLSQHATDLNELINREVLDLKEKKDALLDLHMQVSNKLRRIQNNLSKNIFLRSKHLKSLHDFFPNVNLEKISQIETFHDGLKKILRGELKSSEKTLSNHIEDINSSIREIDNKISAILEDKIDNPSIIIDRVMRLNSYLNDISQENKFYETSETLKEEVKVQTDALVTQKQKICDVVSGLINNKVRAITTQVYSAQRNAPKLRIKGNQYIYETQEDTGTGKAYSNLILFDLAVFTLTRSPFIIHDSLLFKNIENDAVKKIISIYDDSTKQIFIAIDEINKYGKETTDILEKAKVLKLADDKLLYIKDWRSNS